MYNGLGLNIENPLSTVSKRDCLIYYDYMTT
jgi:hypothetical protein